MKLSTGIQVRVRAGDEPAIAQAVLAQYPQAVVEFHAGRLVVDLEVGYVARSNEIVRLCAAVQDIARQAVQNVTGGRQ